MPNRLAQAASLYLRKHAENPIDWWPWCDEAIATARQEDKPIFLSIGYSSCHWCTVMEGEAFSDPAIAAFLNANFLAIKVDREERPDVDSIYMQALQMMTGQGGWPLNVFLLPDTLVPFYGGTYFAMHPLSGRPGFMQVLQRLREMYDREQDKLRSVETDLLQALHEDHANMDQARVPDGATLLKGLTIAAKITAPNGRAPSFPSIPYALTALRGLRYESAAIESVTTQKTATTNTATMNTATMNTATTNTAIQPSDIDAFQVCTQRAIHLSLGGIYDHVGGGFHRYTVDATWTVPHFEKMLYDNGLLLKFLAELWSAGSCEPAFEQAIEGTFTWLKREMTAPEGYFYAAQDADNFIKAIDTEPEEGAFYVWSWSELQTLLTPAELHELQQRFTITPAGNFEGQNVLQRRDSGHLSAIAQTALDKLFQARYGTTRAQCDRYAPARSSSEAKTQTRSGRIPPVTDTKMIVAWNALAISGLARAAMVFHRIRYLDLAQGAAAFILQHQRSNDLDYLNHSHHSDYSHHSNHADHSPSHSDPLAASTQPPQTSRSNSQRLQRLNYDGKVSVLAQAEDYALLIKALLDLHQACQSLCPGEAIAQTYLTAAIDLQAEFDQYLWCAESGGYYNTDPRADLIVRERSTIDNATPAPNGIAISNLVRLCSLTNQPHHYQRAEQALQAFAELLETTPQACPSLIAALDDFQHNAYAQVQPHWAATCLERYFPSVTFHARYDLPADAAGIVCSRFTCYPPAIDLTQLFEQLQETLDRP